MEKTVYTWENAHSLFDLLYPPQIAGHLIPPGVLPKKFRLNARPPETLLTEPPFSVSPQRFLAGLATRLVPFLEVSARKTWGYSR